MFNASLTASLLPDFHSEALKMHTEIFQNVSQIRLQLLLVCFFSYSKQFTVKQTNMKVFQQFVLFEVIKLELSFS